MCRWTRLTISVEVNEDGGQKRRRCQAVRAPLSVFDSCGVGKKLINIMTNRVPALTLDLPPQTFK